jgi:small ligand-binding sensory domain FIST
MNPFLHAHATHPDWRAALASVRARLDAQRDESTGEATLGWIYITDHYAPHAHALHGELQRHWPGVSWVGTVGIGIASSGVECFDEPALAVMLAALPRGDFRVFSGARPLAGFDAHVAQVHAEASTPELSEVVAEMSARTATGYLFGGLAASRTRSLHIADGVFEGGLSGVAFSEGVSLVSRVTQGCQPVGPVRTVTEAQGNLVLALDDEPALDCLLCDLHVDAREPRRLLPALRQTLVGLADADADVLAHAGQFGSDTRVRHLIGIEPNRRGLAIADVATEGMQLGFCQRNAEAARRDLVRICAEIRDELEPEELPLEQARAMAGRPARGSASVSGESSRIAGAIYVSCAGRGGPHFGAPSAELAIVAHALGDVPLVGFFAAGEIARRHLYGYTGVLTVFRA